VGHPIVLISTASQNLPDLSEAAPGRDIGLMAGRVERRTNATRLAGDIVRQGQSQGKPRPLHMAAAFKSREVSTKGSSKIANWGNMSWPEKKGSAMIVYLTIIRGTLN
jgi:hypothetical protein